MRGRPRKIFLTFNGVDRSLVEWANVLNVPYNLLFDRFKRGWDAGEVLFGRKRKPTGRKLTIDGRSLTVSEWSEVVGTKADTIRDRLKRGWSEREAVLHKAQKVLPR